MTGGLTRRSLLGGVCGLPFVLTGDAIAGCIEAFAKAAVRAPWLAGFASAHADAFAAPLTPLAGRLPPDLTGVLWRNGPAGHDRFGQRYTHWFDGDGMVHAVTFTEAGVSHRARMLDTRKRRYETQAGDRVVPAFGTVPAKIRPVTGPDDMNTANTSILAHAGRLMALWEGGSALTITPETLAAGRFVVWGAKFAGTPFGAHPKVEPDGTLWNIGCIPAPRPILVFYRIDRDGRLVHANPVPIAPLGMVHDFVVTAGHIVVMLAPFVIEPDRFAPDHVSYLDAHEWRPDLGTRVVVVNKDSLEVERYHDLPPGFHFHHGNGWEDTDGTIRLDLCQAPDPGFVTNDLRAVMCGAREFGSTHPAYHHVVLRPGGRAEIERMAPGVAEFPVIDLRQTGSRHRAVFALAGDGAAGDWPLRRIVRFDPANGLLDGWSYPADHLPEEHVFVPRGDREGEGWLIGPFLDAGRGVTGLDVFDAMHLADGPVWQGLLPYPLPLGLHGTFVRS